MDRSELNLAQEVLKVTKQIEKRNHDYIKYDGGYIKVCVSNMETEKKQQLKNVINDFMKDSLTPIRKLKAKRRSLLMEIIKKTRV